MGAANDESNYHAVPKRTYLFTILAEVCFIVVWLTYYTCVANQYVDLMNESYKRQERANEAEAKRLAEEQKVKDDKKKADDAAAAAAKK
jgi:hypothetical protein